MKYKVEITVTAGAQTGKKHEYEVRNHDRSGEVAAARTALKAFEESGLASNSSVLPYDLTISVTQIDEDIDD